MACDVGKDAHQLVDQLKSWANLNPPEDPGRKRLEAAAGAIEGLLAENESLKIELSNTQSEYADLLEDLRNCGCICEICANDKPIEEGKDSCDCECASCKDPCTCHECNEQNSGFVWRGKQPKQPKQEG